MSNWFNDLFINEAKAALYTGKLLWSTCHLVSQIVAVQEGEGDPSPDNVRPIVGWDKVSVTRTGRNLFDVSKIVSNTRITNNGDGSITVTTSSTSAGAPAGDIPTLETYAPGLVVGQTYTLSAHTSGSTAQIFLSLASKPWKFGTAMTITDDVLKSNVIWYASGLSTTATISEIQIELGDTATPYEPYTGQTLTADLPETVYGGAIDWVTGVLTVTHAHMVFAGTEDWRIYNNGFYIWAGLPGSVASVKNVQAKTVCSHYVIGNFAGGSYMLTLTLGKVSPRYVNTGHETVEDWKNYVASQHAAGSPITVSYLLAQPYTIQLTPQQLDLLGGTNRIWSDCGDTDLVYVKRG